ncbi:MAG TPA: Nramp family divalent metal transporter [Planctomycetaceae bacterium]|nr:Nramp family divalent metal transporter [Planctomycetaceae bacterium]
MPNSGAPPAASDLPARRWYHRIGPGLITACVVIGPGSILTSSRVGAEHGYGLAWVVVAAVAFMMVYTALGAKLGVVARESAGQLVADRAGRWLAVLIGLGVFFISAAFQFGNNLGVHSAFAVYVKFDYFVVVFNALALAFLFGFKNLYRAVERLMMAFVALMLVSFAVNLFFARPDLGQLAAGLLPGQQAQIDLTLLGLVGTTFVITAAYYQSYLVRQKGWTRPQLEDGLRDARAGAVIMALITLMIMTTAAAVLRGQTLDNVKDVAQQLRPLFGREGQALFCLGLFSAAYSSFLVNSMIGGFILSDGLGLGSRPDQLVPKLFTAAVLLTGMGVALWAIKTDRNPVPAIVAAQAVTVLAAPLMAGTLLWLTNRRDIMGADRNGPVVNALAGVGFVLLVAMAWQTATVNIPRQIETWRTPPQPETSQTPLESQGPGGPARRSSRQGDSNE